MTEVENKLHWTQRIALIRHNLHAAGRTGDFTFFKQLQAAGFLEGTNHVTALAAVLDDDSDTIMAAMDNMNAGLAYAHQDAFKNVYDAVKLALSSDSEQRMQEAKSKLFVDMYAQKTTADLAIDKVTSSAINLINQQPAEAQEAAANVWITGMTIIADAMDVSLKQLDQLEFKLDDFMRMEESWHMVKASVVFAITGLKGVFELMDPNLPSSKSSPRNSSIASASASVFRRLSNAFAPSAANSRTPSVASLGAPPLSSPFAAQHSAAAGATPVYRTPNFRSGGNKVASQSVVMQAPFSVPPPVGGSWTQHQLTTIPPTPGFGDSQDPFDTTPAVKDSVPPTMVGLASIPSSPTDLSPAGTAPSDENVFEKASEQNTDGVAPEENNVFESTSSKVFDEGLRTPTVVV